MTNTNKKIWFYFTITIVVSYIPSLCRLFLSLGSSIHMYDTKDTLFASLALLLSNFTLIGDSEKITSKNTILFLSAFMLIPIIIFTVVLMLNEKNENYHEPSGLVIATYVFSIASAIISFSANNTVYQSS